MALSDIREQIRTIIAGVSGIGVVHNYNRLPKDWSKFLDLFKDENDKINGVMFSRVGSTQRMYADTGLTTRTHHFKFLVFYDIEDDKATSLTFQDTIIEGIVTAFDVSDSSKFTLNSSAFAIAPTGGGEMAGIQVDLIDDRTIGRISCHYAELSLYVQSLETA